MFFIYVILFNLDGTVTKSMYDAYVLEEAEASFHSYSATYLRARDKYSGFLVQMINEHGAPILTKDYRMPEPETAEV